MTREQEKTLDVEIVEDSNSETQELAELNSYKNELIAKSREICLGMDWDTLARNSRIR